jgi:hypothetical protein
MKKEIWIASHITCEQGLTYFQLCIESLKYLSNDITIIISYSGLIIDLPKHIVVYEHKTQLSQFQHIQYIFNTRKDLLSDNDVILFLDDDDMLLTCSDIEYKGVKNITEKVYIGQISYLHEIGFSNILYRFKSPFDEILDNSEISGFIGLQILGDSNITIDQVHNFCNEIERELVDDFSGTIIRKQYLQIFLFNYYSPKSILYDNILEEFCYKYIENTTDTKFMDFIIEKTPNGKMLCNPTVFHRVKQYESEWM